MKKIISCIIFVALTLAILLQISALVFPKAISRYYIMDRYLEEHDEPRDVQIFGSCHSYTSFVPKTLEEETGLTSFVYGNAGEIIPTTYLRMVEQFKRHTPSVVLIDIWGINAYETYDSTEKILTHYLSLNLQALPYSKERSEIIADFDTLNPLEINFPLSQYKARLLDGSLTDLDFHYDIEEVPKYAEDYIAEQAKERTANAGFLPQPSVSVPDYAEKQKHVSDTDVLEIEPVIVKYLEKIIALCEEKNVELIFYRAPYISTENELRKLNHLRQICNEHDVLFLDLEKEISFDYETDFYDIYHLSTTGAQKLTAYLAPYILEGKNSH